MSKVIHVRDDEHQRAKEYCKRINVPMTEWISRIINEAVLPTVVSAQKVLPKPVQTGKHLKQFDEEVSEVLDRPPFWEKEKADDTDRTEE